MPNITLSIDENLLKKSRKYAQKRGKSLNSLVRDLLNRELEERDSIWLDEVFLLMDKTKANSKGQKWSREELYEK
ncbi:MAG: DUF6364 family protein [Ignavibacteriaceae bacterium]